MSARHFSAESPADRARSVLEGFILAFVVALIVVATSAVIGVAQAATGPDRELRHAAEPTTIAQLPAEAPAPAPAAVTAVRLDFAARSVALAVSDAAKQAVATLRIPFGLGEADITSETRRAAALLFEAMQANAPRGASFALLVSGGDAELAFRRAQALRQELMTRHRIPAERLVAAARTDLDPAPGDDGLARLDIVALDPRCGECGATGLRAVALDSAAARLVKASTETGPRSARSPRLVTPPAASAAVPQPPRRPERLRTADEREPRSNLAKRTDRIDEAEDDDEIAPAPRRQQLAQRRAAGFERGCRPPRIIIDDYYPGGPMLRCDGSWR